MLNFEPQECGTKFSIRLTDIAAEYIVGRAKINIRKAVSLRFGGQISTGFLIRTMAATS